MKGQQKNLHADMKCTHNYKLYIRYQGFSYLKKKKITLKMHKKDLNCVETQVFNSFVIGVYMPCIYGTLF